MTIRPPRHGRRRQQSACPAGRPEASVRRIRRHSPEEIYVQVGRHARHGRLTFSGSRGKYRHKRRRTARPRRRSMPPGPRPRSAARVPVPRSCSTSTTAVRRGGATVRLPGFAAAGCSVARVRGHEVAWGPDTGGQHEVGDRESQRKGRAVHRWIARRRQVHGPARTPQFPSNERWSSVTLMRSSHPAQSSAAGAHTRTRRCCR